MISRRWPFKGLSHTSYRMSNTSLVYLTPHVQWHWLLVNQLAHTHHPIINSPISDRHSPFSHVRCLIDWSMLLFKVFMAIKWDTLPEDLPRTYPRLVGWFRCPLCCHRSRSSGTENTARRWASRYTRLPRSARSCPTWCPGFLSLGAGGTALPVSSTRTLGGDMC